MNTCRPATVLIAVAVTLALTACGSKGPTAPSSTPSATVSLPSVTASTFTPSTPPPSTPAPATPPLVPTNTLVPTSSTGAGSSSGGTCSIRANSGNCYNAGEFCRKSDVGKTTTDAAGRPITCGYENGDTQPHWHY